MSTFSRSQKLKALRLAIIPTILVIAAALTTVTPAFAAVTLTKDGLANAEAASCVIDIDSLRDFSFTTSNSDVFSVKRNTSTYTTATIPNCDVYGVYIWGTPKKGVTNLEGYFDLVWDDALLDNAGKRHDLHARFSNIVVNWKYDPNVGAVSQQLLMISDSSIRLSADPEALIRWDSSSNSYKSKLESAWVNGTYYALGISCDVTFWNEDSSSLKYNLYAQDIDQPDRFTGNGYDSCSWKTAWAESFIPLSSYGTYHVEKNSTLEAKGSTIFGTTGTDSSEERRSAFVTLGTMAGSKSPLSFTWHGSGCCTRILQDWSYLLRTRVVNGVGGSIDVNTGSEVFIKSNESDTWNETGTIPKSDYLVTATPDSGYHIASIWVDNVRASDDQIAAGSVSLATIAKNHDVAVQFEKDADKTGDAILVKSSANTQVTDDNPCYSLENAQYGIYSDEACETAVGTLVTDASGTSNTVSLVAGTYYVKETSAPTGYALDTETYQVTVKEGETANVEVSDIPQGNPVDVAAQKVDADTAAASPQGSASLEGAEFALSYYAGYYEDGELPDEATRVWVLRTDAEGKAHLDEDHLVTGDDLYLFDGQPALPLGTIAITETKAPKGYLLPDASTRVQQVSTTSTEAVLSVFSIPDETNPTTADPVIRGGVSVKKTNRTGETALAGAVFSISNASEAAVVVGGESYQPGETCLTIESGEDGIASSAADALPYGSYTIVESKAPEGYLLDSSWTESFDIVDAGQLVDLTAKPAKNDRVTTTASLTATKVFDGSSQGRALEKDLFSFELLDEAGKVIQTKTNDENGEIAFATLVFDYQDAGKEFSYTIREVKGDDAQIVYDAHEEHVTISVQLDDDGALSARVTTDEDGIVFHNSTVAAVEMPLTGQAGLHGMLPAVLIALAAGGALAGRQYLKRDREGRRRR